MTTTTLPALYDADLLALIRNTDGSEPCATTDPDLWHSFDSGNAMGRRGHTQPTHRSRALPVLPPHRPMPRLRALTHPEVSGVWGSLTANERTQLRDAAA